MRKPENLRLFALTSLILLVGVLRAHEAHAQEPEVLIVAGGCFWCVESDFESVQGVTGAISGYTGGTSKNPTYKRVSRGGTGHYEAVQIFFDPAQITRKTLVEMFFRSIDPTDSSGQFCDRGDSYRSAIFVSDSDQLALVEQIKAQAQTDLGQYIVTPVLQESRFYPAEAYHQDYYKGSKLVFTRFGPKRQSEAYKRYRQACGRDDRLMQLWADAAPFAKDH